MYAVCVYGVRVYGVVFVCMCVHVYVRARVCVYVCVFCVVLCCLSDTALIVVPLRRKQSVEGTPTSPNMKLFFQLNDVLSDWEGDAVAASKGRLISKTPSKKN